MPVAFSWISNKVNRLRSRHNMEQSKASKPALNSFEAKFTPEVRNTVTQFLKDRMEECEHYYSVENTPEPEICQICKSRLGRFSANVCIHTKVFCRYCCYDALYQSLVKYLCGEPEVRCTKCEAEIHILTQRKTRRISGGSEASGDQSDQSEGSEENEENCPVEERSMSVQDFTTSIIRAAHINRGYESTGSQ
ncbi:hypothetical protein B9Z55_010758 [Caenorhabditis nigoni]|uniref:Uncharacterized protein n=1 Tax=Caenorhabditis nigoni TaxID=1611254 RepID=A0A2G5UH80_9PELO|nr:hypothetical protein B9Z55_010758 [Caenorhabditis nigoni]